jgi:hypothetical protein
MGNNRVTVKDKLRYKTVLCNKFAVHGTCPYGRKCQFAHGEEELRPVLAPSKQADGPEGSAAAGPSTLPSFGEDPLPACFACDIETDVPGCETSPRETSQPPTANRMPTYLRDAISKTYSAMDDVLCPLQLNHNTGKVEINRPPPHVGREDSYNTLSIRRQISLVLRDDSDIQDVQTSQPPARAAAAAHHLLLPDHAVGRQRLVCFPGHVAAAGG